MSSITAARAASPESKPAPAAPANDHLVGGPSSNGLDPQGRIARRFPPHLVKFFGYILRYKPLLAMAVFAGVSKFTLQFVFPLLTGLVADHVIDGKAERNEASSGVLTDAERMEWLVWLSVASIVVLVVYGLATFFRSYLTGQVAFRVIRDIRQDLFGHLHRLSLHFYSKERTGSIVSRVITDISQAAQLVNGGVVAVVMDCGAIFFGIVILLFISWELTIIALAILPIYLLCLRALRPQVRHAGKLVQRSIGKISGNVQEQLAGIALVQTSAAEGREGHRFRNDTEEHYDRVLHQKGLAAFTETLGESLTKLGTAAVAIVAGYIALTRGTVTSGELIQFVGSLAVMYFPVQRFGEINVVYETCMVSIERVFRVFEITPKVREKPDAHPHPPEHGEVTFDGVRFSYNDDSPESLTSLASEDEKGDRDPVTGRPIVDAERPDLISLSTKARKQRVRDELARQMKLERKRRRLAREGKLAGPPPVNRRWVLDGLSFHVPAGQRVALVGPSGSGKTTLVSLLPRLYDVSDGFIRIDGRDVRDYRKKPLREAIGIVQQDSFLFSGNVLDNLLYGRPDASIEEVVAAAEAANADGFIRELPGGYDSPLGERGVSLSGGQRQRLSIARAILKDPKILILDEATSALDVESERLVQEALERLMANRTSFIIAHRLSTVRNADRILVIEAGRVVEDGTHDELVAADQLYAKLARQAFKEND
ncbi:MAG: ABC transporter ATP-binding protein [Planctomycetota bacterium]